MSQPLSPAAFKTINTADGLPQSFVSGLVQDSTGFIWIGTRDGLARYDGRGFKIFRHTPGDTTTLSDNIISSLYLDKEGRLWISFEAGDIDVLNTATENLFHFTKDSAFKSTFASVKPAQSFAEDGKGNIWMLNVTSNGIFICHPANRTLSFYPVSVLGLPNHKITSFASSGGNIALITNNSLVTMNADRKLLKISPYPFTETLTDDVFTWKTIPFIVRKNGDMVIIDKSRLVIYQPVKDSFTTLSLPPVKNLINFSIAQDDKGQVFFDQDNNVYALSPQNTLSLWKPKEENPAYGFKSMLVDQSGVLWLGSNGAGIQLCDLRLPRLPGIAYKQSFHEDILRRFLHIPEEEIQKTPLYSSSSYYTRWTKGTNHDIWLSRAGLGINNITEVYHYSNGHLTVPRWHYTDTITAHHVEINGMAISPSGAFWGIDFYLRPVYFDTITHAVTVYPPLDSVNTSYSFTVSSVMIDQDEKFWISTALNGLFCYDTRKHRVIHYSAGEVPGSLPTNQLMNIIQDPHDPNTLWVGSLGGGLVKFDKTSGQFRSYTTKDGLPNNTVYAVVMDAKGVLWCSSNKGIFSLDPKKGIVLQTFTSKDGLLGDEFNRYHFLQLPDGRIAFGGVDGYTVFDPLSIANDNYQPHVVLTGIAINNAAADFGYPASPFHQSINALHKIELPYDQNFLTFEFAALQYNITEKLQYRYQLESVNDDWVYAGNNNIATYTNLPPGNYVFKVNATNTSGKWSLHVKTISIIIEPPFWKTWWFITLSLLAAAGFAWYLIRKRITHVREEEQQKALFEREASELKAQALRAQMNPHFIFNCLNSIKSLIHEDNKRQAIIYLTTFSKLIRNQMNNAQQEVSLQDELETCQLYAELESLRFGSHIVCEFNVEETVDTLSFRVPPLIIQPFIENAIWHGVLPKEGGKVIVSVIQQDHDGVQCTIEDDGIGREVSTLNKSRQSSTYESKGMKLVKNRLNLYNTIHNYGGTIEVIDKKDNQQNATGTIVIITFKKGV